VAVIGAFVGGRVVGRIHPDKLRKAFGWFVLVMVVFILGQQKDTTFFNFASQGLFHAVQVIAGLPGVAAFFTWIIRRPVRDQSRTSMSRRSPWRDVDSSAAPTSGAKPSQD
jgi:hypothetical protein